MAEAPNESLVTHTDPPVPSPTASSLPGPPPPFDPTHPAYDNVRTLIGARGARASARTEEILQAMAAALAQQQGQPPPQPSLTATTTSPPSAQPLPPQPQALQPNEGANDNENDNIAINNANGNGENGLGGTANSLNDNDNSIGDDGRGLFFNTDRDPDEFDELLVPALVRHRHENCQIWPFWLVSVEGQRALQAMQKATTDLSLLSDKNSSLPPGVIPDADLTYAQFRDGVQFFLNLLRFSDKEMWPDRYEEAWVEFYADLDTHPVKRAHLGERAIVIYANQVRMRFHAELATPSRSMGLTPLKVSGTRLREIRLGLELEETQKVQSFLLFCAPLHRFPHGYTILRLLAAPCTDSQCSSLPFPICSCRMQWLTMIFLAMQRILFPDPQSLLRRSTFKRQRSTSPPFPDRGYSQDMRGVQSFRAGAGGRTRAVCAVCLGRHRHETKYCRAAYFVSANGAPSNTRTRCHRDSKGRLFNDRGQPVCYNWQRPQRCEASGPDHAYLHECSACGDSTHGAAQCSLSANAVTKHSL